MNRYHFNFRSGDEIVPDTRGIYLANDDEAFDEAIRTCRDLLVGTDIREKRNSAVEVTDADGTVIAAVPLGYAERLKGE
jgi:hypothetical protein